MLNFYGVVDGIANDSWIWNYTPTRMKIVNIHVIEHIKEITTVDQW